MYLLSTSTIYSQNTETWTHIITASKTGGRNVRHPVPATASAAAAAAVSSDHVTKPRDYSPLRPPPCTRASATCGFAVTAVTVGRVTSHVAVIPSRHNVFGDSCRRFTY